MKFLVNLMGSEQRAKALAMVKSAPEGWLVELRERKRSLNQNAKMWAMLTEISLQKKHCGRRLTPEVWKCLFMHELGVETSFIQDLSGNNVIPLGYSTSRLTLSQMGDLIEVMLKWGAENGVQFGRTD